MALLYLSMLEVKAMTAATFQGVLLKAQLLRTDALFVDICLISLKNYFAVQNFEDASAIISQSRTTYSTPPKAVRDGCSILCPERGKWIGFVQDQRVDFIQTDNRKNKKPYNMCPRADKPSVTENVDVGVWWSFKIICGREAINRREINALSERKSQRLYSLEGMQIGTTHQHR